MPDEHETESKAWAIEAAAAEAASRAAEEMHRPPVVPMERVVDRTDIERGERAGQKRSQEPGFPRFFAELNMGLILTAFAIVAFKTPNHFAFGGTSGVSVILSTLFPTLPCPSASLCGLLTRFSSFWALSFWSARQSCGASSPRLRCPPMFRFLNSLSRLMSR